MNLMVNIMLNYDCMYESKWGDTLHVPVKSCVNGKQAHEKSDEVLIDTGHDIEDLTFIMATAKRGDH